MVNICQICQESKSAKPIVDLNQDVIKYVFANVEYEEQVLICIKCFENIERLFDFKKKCLEIESKIALNCDLSNNEEQFKIDNIVGVDLKNEELESDLSICRLCLETQTHSSSVISIAEPDVKQMFNKCLPELNMDVIKDPVSCEKCFHIVEQYFSMLLSLENKLVKYELGCNEEISIISDDLKLELEVKDEQQEINTYDYQPDNTYTTLNKKELCEDGSTRADFLTQNKDLTENAIKHRMHAKEFNKNQHMRVDTNDRSFNCEVCRKGFTWKCHLTDHMITHTGEKPFKCDVCDSRFVYKRGLKEHHMKVHASEKPFKCDTCDKTFIQKTRLTCHMRIHTGEKPFKCDVCDKEFKQKRRFKQHLTMHTGEKAHSCNVCNKRFIDKSYLTYHMKTHIGDKCFKCNICDKGFIEKRGLTCHMRTHTSEKPFKCDICDKVFKQKRRFKQHLSMHSGEVASSCSICNKGFIDKYYLTYHMRTHEAEKPFKCDTCDRGFIYNYLLVKHMRKHTRKAL